MTQQQAFDIERVLASMAKAIESGYVQNRFGAHEYAKAALIALIDVLPDPMYGNNERLSQTEADIADEIYGEEAADCIAQLKQWREKQQ